MAVASGWGLDQAGGVEGVVPSVAVRLMGVDGGGGTRLIGRIARSASHVAKLPRRTVFMFVGRGRPRGMNIKNILLPSEGG